MYVFCFCFGMYLTKIVIFKYINFSAGLLVLLNKPVNGMIEDVLFGDASFLGGSAEG